MKRHFLKKFFSKQDKAPGYILLLAVLIVSILLAVGFSVSGIGVKELALSFFMQQSQEAYSAADRVTECATYWDTAYQTAEPPLPYSPFPTTTLAIDGGTWVYPPRFNEVACAGQLLSVSDWQVFDESPTTATTKFTLNFTGTGDNGTCATVTVIKSKSGAQSVTSISSSGLNTCDTTKNRRASRGAQQNLSKTCIPFSNQSDTVLVVDLSDSMSWDAADGAGRTRMVATRDALAQFIDTANAPPDQLAIVSFWHSYNLDQPLTTDKTVLKSVAATLDWIRPFGNTQQQLGIWQARKELQSPRHDPTHQEVIVLMTDGEPWPNADEVKRAAIQEADAAKAMGMVIFSVGFGDSIDDDMMRQIATDDEHYYKVTAGMKIEDIYAKILGVINCTF